MLQIGSIKLTNCLVMAPLAGITNLPFRVIVKNLGAGLVTTEMISAKGLTLGHQRTFKYLKSQPEEKPLSVQIFGPDADVMAAAAQIAIGNGASIIDINMGCPARKVVKTGSGSHLLRAPQRVREIVSAVRRVCSVPLTVKIRAGWSPNQPAALEIAKIIEDCGADAITIHPRYATQGFSGQADWSIIADTKEHLKIPVIGNGDVSSPSSAIEMQRQTGCDGIMIGRAAVGNPWIFKQTLEMIQGLEVTSPGLTERRALIEEHFRLLTLDLGETRASKVMRGLLLRYTKGLPNSSRFRGAFTRIRSLEGSMSALDSYFTELEKYCDFSEVQSSPRGPLIARTV